ncbi:MAG: DUF885 domain-containing protein [Eubacterium sp.]|nr:DUF885 domain-containing protein [Eubacterium sp.]
MTGIKIREIIKKGSNSKKARIGLRLAGLGLCIAILFTGSMSAFSSLQARKQPDFASYTQLLFQEQLAADTIGLHYTLAHPENYGITSHEISLGSLDEANILSTRLSCENIRAACSRFDYDTLTTEQQLTYDILDYMLDQNLSGCTYYYYEEPLNPINGIQAELPVLLAEYTFRCQTDVEDYLALLAAVPDYFSEIVTFEEQKSAKGLFMPAFATDAVIAQLSSLLNPPAFSCLTETFPKKLEEVPGLSEEYKNAYLEEHQVLIENSLVPAYEDLSSALSRLRETSKSEGGLCHLPGGSDYYSYLVKKTTASSHSVTELNEMIAEERQQNLSELAKIIKSNPGILSQMSNVKLKWNTPDEMLKHLKTCMSADFPAAPDNTYEVKTVEPAMQKFLSPAFYLTAPMDDPDENNIYINPAYSRSDLELFTTLAHEGYPGHLYETVSSYEQDFLPLRYVLNFGGYTEGWATYVEMQSYCYAGLDETLARALQLNASATLSLYASIDIGVHEEGWDRDIVLEFLSDYGITSVEAADHIYELVAETPANYLKYYVGYLEFLELKKDARLRFGSDYNDKAFHQALLSIGPAPFSIIKEYLPSFYDYDSSDSNA